MPRKKKFHMFLQDFSSAFIHLNNEKLGMIFRWIISYYMTGEEPEVEGVDLFIWDMIKEDQKKQDEFNNGEEPKVRKEPKVHKEQKVPSYPILSPPIPIIKKNIKKKENKFEPPSLESVIQYADSRYVNFGSRDFFEYYEALDWTDTTGKPVKSWKGKVITWAKRDEIKRIMPEETARLYDGQCVSCGSLTEIDSIKRTCKECKGL